MTAYKVAETSELAVGEAKSVRVMMHSGTQLALALIRDTADNWYAIEEMCPHGEVSLAEGEISECQVECWAHGATFNLKTGAATLPSPRDLKTYETRLEEDAVFVVIGE